jgi:L-phenylalanine/L-methionine N-acetyltransferase
MNDHVTDSKTYSFICRRASQEDAPALAALASSPAVLDSLLSMPFVHRDLYAELCHSHWDLPLTLVAKTKDENDILGFATLSASGKNRRQAHLGLVSVAVREVTQGHGVGSCLIGQLIRSCDAYYQLSRLEAMIWVDNAASLRIFEKNGFEIEGKLKAWAAGPDGFYDVFLCARLNPAFASARALQRQRV